MSKYYDQRMSDFEAAQRAYENQEYEGQLEIDDLMDTPEYLEALNEFSFLLSDW